MRRQKENICKYASLHHRPVWIGRGLNPHLLHGVIPVEIALYSPVSAALRMLEAAIAAGEMGYVDDNQLASSLYLPWCSNLATVEKADKTGPKL